MKHQESDFHEYDIRKIILKFNQDLGSDLEQRNVHDFLKNLALLDSLIESLLKMIVFIDLHKHGLSKDQMQKKWNKLRFGEAQKCAFQMGLIDETLFTQIETLRVERNSLIHLFWFYNYKIDENSNIEKIHNRLKVVLELSRIFEKMEPWTQDKGFFDLRSFTNLQRDHQENAIPCRLLKEFY